MDFLKLAHKRYSCRKFSNQVVEQEKIDKVIEAGMVAPTAVNAQPFKIWVIKTPSEVQKVALATPFTFGTSVIFAVGAKTEGAYQRNFDGKNFSEVDASIVATQMMLEIHDLGLGTTWVGHFDPARLKELFPQMANYEIVALFPTGYPAADAVPSDKHEVSKPFDELVEVL